MHSSSNRLAVAWVLMVAAVALHVVDETLTDFLPFYNELVSNLKERIGFFPMPTFSFGIWLGGLIGAVVIGFLLTPFMARGGRLSRAVAVILGLIMIANSLGHMIGSIFFGRFLPGFWSSPILLATAVMVVAAGVRGRREY